MMSYVYLGGVTSPQTGRKEGSFSDYPKNSVEFAIPLEF